MRFYQLLIVSLFSLAVTFMSFVSAQCPFAPTVNTISQPNCYNNYGVVNVSGLPVGNWTLYATPVAGCGGVPVTISGTGTTSPMTGLTPGCGYTFHYDQASPACTSNQSSTVNVSTVPSPPSTPIVLSINQPNCPPGATTGCVLLGNLPSTGAWFIKAIGPSGPPGIITTNLLGTTHVVCGLGTGLWTFTVTRVIDSCVSAGVTVNIVAPTNPNPPTINQVTQPSCAANYGAVSFNGLPSGMSWTLTASPNLGIPNNGNFTGTGTNATFSNLTPGTCYQFTLKDSNNCISSATAPVCINAALSVPPVPTATIVQPTCPQPTGTITVTSPIGAQYLYSINGTNFQISPVFSAVSGGTYTLYVQQTGSGCTTPSASTYVMNPAPTPPVISIPVVHNVTCNGANNGWAVGKVISGGTPPFVYSWSPVNIANDTATNLAPGTYNFVVVDALQCVVIQSITIGQPNVLVVVGDSTPINCATGQLGTMDVTASGGVLPYTYTWSTGQTGIDSIFNLNAGNYTVIVADSNNCQVIYGATIAPINSLPVNITPGDITINPGVSFAANVTPGSIFTWTPSQGLSCSNCPNPIVSPDTTTLYFVNVSNANGCLGIDSMLVTVKLICGEFFVPTIFSPNGVGPDANNKLQVFCKEICVKDFSLMIYDRWGQKVFESVDVNASWDGFYKGRPAQEGNYVFELTVQLYDESIVRKTGSLTLVR